MISDGRLHRATDALFNSRNYKQRSESVTLGNVVNRLNSTSEKMAVGKMKKAAILESLHHASRHEIVAREEARDSRFDMKSMRKSLQAELKNDGRKTSCYEERRDASTRKHRGPERARSAMSLGRLSSASSRSGVVLRTLGTETKYSARETSRDTCKDNTSNKKSAQSIYSRHMSNVDNNIRETSEHDSSEKPENSSKPSITLEVESPATQSDESTSDFESFKGSQQVFLSGSMRENSAESKMIYSQENISSKEDQVLNSLTDPQLKESLQNIIKRRRSSVRFVRCGSGYGVVNLEKPIIERAEEDPEKNHDQQHSTESKSALEDATNSDTSRSVKSATTRRISAASRHRSPSVATSISGSCIGEASSQSRMQRTRKLGRQEQRVSVTRRVSSARSCPSATSRRSLNSPILRRRKQEVETGETRVIRPATAKGYVPNLTNRKVSRKQSVMSSPEILTQREQAKNLAEVKMIREFLLMYAKVTTKNKLDHSHEPVRMMSQTPELVIKSAIGQFLTRAFPSGESQEWHGLNATTQKERYEEQQRSKLLRIKICMKHLAAVA